MLVMVVFFIAFRWIHLSTPLIRLFLLVLILLLMPTLNFLPVWLDRKSGSAGMPRPRSYAVFCLKKKNRQPAHVWPVQVARADEPRHGGLRNDRLGESRQSGGTATA